MAMETGIRVTGSVRQGDRARRPLQRFSATVEHFGPFRVLIDGKMVFEDGKSGTHKVEVQAVDAVNVRGDVLSVSVTGDVSGDVTLDTGEVVVLGNAHDIRVDTGDVKVRGDAKGVRIDTGDATVDGNAEKVHVDVGSIKVGSKRKA